MPATNIATEIQRINTAVGVIRAAMANLGISVSNSDTIDILAAKLANADIGSGDMNYYGECTTASGTSAKTVSISGFKLEIGAIVAIKFANPVNSGATLNISGTGAKEIYYRGYALQSKIINALDTVTLIYDGTNFKILSIDGTWRSKIDLTGNPNAVVYITNTTYGISDTVQLDSNGKAIYVAKRPGTYVLDLSE